MASNQRLISTMSIKSKARDTGVGILFWTKRNVGNIEIMLNAKKIGNDYLVTLIGGRDHVGAVAIGLFDEKSQRASSSVITIPGHREEQLALKGARRVSIVTKKTTIFIAGIHKDNINQEDIINIISVACEMLEDLITFVKRKNEQEEKDDRSNGGN